MTLPLFNDGLDDTPADVTETGYLGVNMSLAPNLIGAGVLARAKNLWLGDDGLANTRPGCRIVSLLPTQTLLAGDLIVQGLAFYSVPGGFAKVISWRNGRIYAVDSSAPGAMATEILQPVHASNPVCQAQLVTKLFFSDRDKLRWLAWSGSAWESGEITQMKEGAALVALPKFGQLKVHRFRLLGIPVDSDAIYPSDIGDAALSGNWNSLKSVRVGDGDGDPIVTVISGQSSLLTVLKQASCWAVDTSDQDSANWAITKLTGLTGCVAPNTAVQLGQDILFLSRYGVVSLSGLTATDSISQSTTLSSAVQPVIDAINWDAVSSAWATKWRDLYLLFLPTGNATTPNVCLPFNVQTRQWLGDWTFDLTDSRLGHVDTNRLVDESGAILVDSDGRQLTDHADVTAPYGGMVCGVVTRFAGKEDTILGDNTGRLFRLDALYDDDDNESAVTSPIESYAVLRAWGFDAARYTKQPFLLDADFRASTCREADVLLIRDDAESFPDVPLEESELVDSGFAAANGPTIPHSIPLKLERAKTLKKSWNISDHSPFREVQVVVRSRRGNLGLGTVKMAAFIDTVEVTP